MTSTDNLKKTSLYKQHVNLGAKLIPFGDWVLPVSYQGSIIEEHKTVREKCGLFDVSHMGEVRVRGPQAKAFVQHLTINDIDVLAPGKGQYSAMLNENAGFVDDLIVYQIHDDEFFLVVNASNVDKDYKWIKKQAAAFKVEVLNESDTWSQIAVQGPNCYETIAAILNKHDQEQVKKMDYMEIVPCTIFDSKACIGRTGYTGEYGFEIYLKHDVAEQAWTNMLETTHKTGVKPIGLGARDTLRLEACYLLYGNDMNETINPLEAGINWAVKLEAADFIGKSVLVDQKQSGVKFKTVCFKMDDPGIARHDMKVYRNNSEIGIITSGSFLPTLEFAGGMMRIQSNAAGIGDQVEVDIRGKRKLAKIVKKPLYVARIK